MNSIDDVTITSDLSIGAFLDIYLSHFNHGPLEIHVKHGSVEGIHIDEPSSCRGFKQCLVGEEDPCASLQGAKVVSVEGVSGRIKGLLRVISAAACLGQGFSERSINSGVCCIQSGLER